MRTLMPEEGMLRDLCAWTACALCILTGSPAFAGEIRGCVTDRASRSPLPCVNLRLTGTRLGAVSDSAGSYLIPNVPAGTYRLQASLIGYQTAVLQDLAVRSSHEALRQDVALRADAIPLNEVVVTPGRFSVIQGDPTASQMLSREEVQAMPQIGEDAYRAVMRLPGVSGNDYSARFTVRGGDYDQTLVTLDGLELDEPFHMKDVAGGGLSIVDVEVISGIDLMTGGFPAEYGDRQSAVLEMKSRRPRPGRRTSAGLGLMNARVLSEGASENFGWLASARRGYIDLALKLVGEQENLSPDYYDLFGKLTFGRGTRQRFALNALWASDHLRFASGAQDNRFNSRYGNGYAWFTWETGRGAWLHARSLSYAGRTTQRRKGKTFFTGTDRIDEIVDDDRRSAVFGVKSDGMAQVGRRHLLKFGFDLRGLGADYDYFKRDRVTPRSRARYDTTRAAQQPSGYRAGLYAGDKWRVFGRLTADVGLRYDRHSYTGEGRISPRAGVAFAPDDETVLRVAWGRYDQAQGVGQLDVQDGIHEFRRATVATHYVAGIERRLGPGLQVRVEGYIKTLRRIRDRFENLRDEVEFMPETRGDRVHLFPQTGVARGVEVYLKNDARGRLSWWTSYAFATTYETHDPSRGPQGIRGRRVPRKFDQRHTLLVDLIYRPSPVWSLSAAWQIRSGWPFTPRHLAQGSAPDGAPTYSLPFGDICSERYPPFHRLDAKVSRRFVFRTWQLSTALEVINLYNRRNVRNYTYQIGVREGQVVVNQQAQGWLPLLPSFTVSSEF